MPASRARACFTIWFSDAPRQGPRATPPSEALRSALQQAAENGGRLPDAAAAQLLRQPDIQKLAAKLHYAEHWAASIEVPVDCAWSAAALIAGQTVMNAGPMPPAAHGRPCCASGSVPKGS
jgi:hypothetical protein